MHKTRRKYGGNWMEKMKRGITNKKKQSKK